MFEDSKWSEALKKEASEYLREQSHNSNISCTELNLFAGSLIKLVDLAIEEGRLDVQENPEKFGLMSEEDAQEMEREPQRDESRD
jgi:hypothetical protein